MIEYICDIEKEIKLLKDFLNLNFISIKINDVVSSIGIKREDLDSFEININNDKTIIVQREKNFSEDEKKVVEYFIYRFLKNEISDLLTNGSKIINDLSKIKEKNEKFNKNLLDEIVKILLSIIEIKDKEIFEHSIGVEYYSILIARKYGFSDEEIEKIRFAALLHDIGKITLKDEILFKPTKLREDEFEIIKKHPEIGYKILSVSDLLRDIANYVLLHHEWCNGLGYPFGLKENEIPIQAQIISIADYIEVFLQGRNYLQRKNKDEIIKELESLRNVKFISNLVDKAIEVLKENV